MATRICKRFSFDAAHMLPLHDGKCRNLHGHTYLAELEAAGDVIEDGPKSGMVIDFGDISALWKAELEPLFDHRYLNDSLAHLLGDKPTTAENMAELIFDLFAELGLPLDRVRLWETTTSWAQYPA